MMGGCLFRFSWEGVLGCELLPGVSSELVRKVALFGGDVFGVTFTVVCFGVRKNTQVLMFSRNNRSTYICKIFVSTWSVY